MNTPNSSSTEIRIRKIALGISIFILLGTLPYWLIDRDSKLSIINMLFAKAIGKYGDINAEALQSLEWAKFSFHLIITSIGLLLFFLSDVSKYIGHIISRFYLVKFFHGDSIAMNKGIKYSKVITASLLIISFYLLIMGLIEATAIPIAQFNLSMLSFLFLLVSWNLGFPDFIVYPELSGNLDYRQQLFFVKLSDNQIAYVQTSTDRDEWHLIPSGCDADFSYKEVYIIPTNKLKHKINGVTFIKTKIGSIIGDIEIRPQKKIEHSIFPTVLNKNQVSNLYSITDVNNFLSDVNFSSKESTLKKDIAQHYQLLDSFFANNPTSPPELWKAEYLKTTKAINDLEFEQNLSKTIEKEIHDNIGIEDVFEVVILIEEQNEGPRKYLDEKIQKHYTEWSKLYGSEINGRINKVVDALAEQIKIGIPDNRIDSIINKISSISSNNFTNTKNEKAIELSNDDFKVLPDKSEMERVNQLINILDNCQKKKQPKEDTISQISESDFFNNMSPNAVDLFIKKILSNWDIENEKKSIDAIKAMVLETIHY